MSRQIDAQLSDLGKRLAQPSASKDALFKVLKQAATLFSEVDQSPPQNITSAMQPSLDALVQPALLKHKDKEIRLLVATCISEIMRIVAPDAPYSDEVLKEIFQLIVATFQGLDETASPSFARRVSILETVAKVRSCVVMLDLECDDLILEMFQTFFSTASEEHPQNVLIAMRTIMSLIIEESEDIAQPLLDVLFTNLLNENKGVSSAAHQLAAAVFQRCTEKLEPYVQRFLTSIMVEGEGSQSALYKDYHGIIYEIYRCAPRMLLAIIPNLTKELLMDQLDVRLKAVELLGRLFSLPGQNIPNEYRQIFLEFLKRFTDKAVEVRLAVVDCAKQCLLANPTGPEAHEFLTALNDRLQDFDDKVRVHVVTAMCDLAKSNAKCIPMDIIKRVAERLRDKEVSVRKDTLQNLTEVYRTFCFKAFEGSLVSDESFDWIPSKIIRCCFDKECKEFRPQAIELVFSEELFPHELPVVERTKHWISMFSSFDKNDVKALERVLIQKQRLQHEMQNYLSLRQKLKEEDSQENQKKLQNCCKGMLASFVDPAVADDNFQKFNQLKDNNVLKALSTLLDANTSLLQSQVVRDDLLKKVGEKHLQYDFMKVLATKCSYMLFGKEHVKAVLNEITMNSAAGKEESLAPSMDLLVEFAGHFPALIEGAEDYLLQLLKEGNEYIKEGVVQILAKAGGSIRGLLSDGSGSIDLMLEKLCIEGSRKQAKYAVQALAALTSDSGLKALSSLYRKLVDLLETSSHLPTVLQSLGCIAQNAISVFETREDEIIEFVVRDLFRRDSTCVDGGKSEWNNASEECNLKVYGLKTLVKSFLPIKDTHLRQRLKGLLGVLVKVLDCGEISDELKSSEVNKAHLRLAAAKGVLRLSRRWDSQISPQIFHATVLIGQDPSMHVRRQFLGKVHQYLKERAIPHKYACAFALSVADSAKEVQTEAKFYIGEFVETCRREARLRQAAMSGQSNGSLVTYHPEYVLVYLVHVLAHCTTAYPALKDGGPTAEFIGPFYRQFQFFLWALVNQDGETCNDSRTEQMESVSLILSIFRTLKNAEDAVDDSKSEVSYMLCDLGILITKELIKNQSYTSSTVGAIPLPSTIYRLLEGTEEAMPKEDGSHLPACLGEADVLAQFWADGIPVLAGQTSSPRKKRGKRSVDERSSSEEAGNKVEPLPKKSRNSETLEGAMNEDSSLLQNVKVSGTPKGLQGRKRTQKEKASTPVGTVTRVTKSVAPGPSDEVDLSLPKRRKGRLSKENGESSFPKEKAGEPDEALVSPVSERKTRIRPKGTSKRLDGVVKGEALEADEPSLDVEGKDGNISKITTIHAEPELKSPSTVSMEKLKSVEGSNRKPSRTTAKKLKLKQETAADSLDQSSSLGEGAKQDGHDLRKISEGHQEPAEKHVAEMASPHGTPRRTSKRASISGLESPESKAGKDQECDEKLVGCRIKVWWPLDKKFYEGVVNSYDPTTKKHKVMYSDGDMEVLRLAKERWELLQGDSSAAKEQPSSPSTPLASLQSLSVKRKPVESPKAQETKELKVSSPRKRGVGSIKPKDTIKVAMTDGHKLVTPPKKAGAAAADDFEFTESIDIPDAEKGGEKGVGDDEQVITVTKGSEKPRRRTVSVKAASEGLIHGSGKESKSTAVQQENGAEATSSPSTSNESDDVPLNAWKSRIRKVH